MFAINSSAFKAWIKKCFIKFLIEIKVYKYLLELKHRRYFLNNLYAVGDMQKTDSLSNIFKKRNLKNIAIYGADRWGEAIFREIHKEINVICFLDLNTKSFNYRNRRRKIPIFKPSNITELSNIDAIIVAPYIKYYQIRKVLRTYTDIDIISIREILGEMVPNNEFVKMSEFLSGKGVSLHLFSRPNPDLLDRLSHNEKMLFSTLKFDIHTQYDFLKEFVYDDIESFSKDYLAEVLGANYYPDTFSEQKSLDMNGKYYNIINGHRLVPEFPEQYKNVIYMFGDCSSFGFAADDEKALPNQLQLLINNSDHKYGVISYAALIRNILLLFDKIKRLPLNKNDIIIYIDLPFLNRDHNHYFFNGLKNIYEHDLIDSFNRPHDEGEIFIDGQHIANRGYRLMAQAIYKKIFFGGFSLNNDAAMVVDGTMTNITDISDDDDEIIGMPAELKEYLAFLKSERVNISGAIGAIVMNCNPLTNGHVFLIEAAAKKVDFLYVFVVEEDKSIFKFNERFKLVREGIGHIKNVKAIRSGMFIISSITFTNYFSKEKLSNVTIDSSLDVKIFAMKIAPILNITIRFAGTEPFCNITRQYNRDMRNILPKFGIEFIEIERLSFNNVQISASEVRELLKENKMNKLKDIVPTNVFEFLEKNKDVLIQRLKTTEVEHEG